MCPRKLSAVGLLLKGQTSFVSVVRKRTSTPDNAGRLQPSIACFQRSGGCICVLLGSDREFGICLSTKEDIRRNRLKQLNFLAGNERRPFFEDDAYCRQGRGTSEVLCYR
jgi:hypothetical protein